MALKIFFDFSRPRGATALDHVLNHDLLLQEAMTNGLGLNSVGMTHFLLERARLSDTEYDNLLTPLGHDYTQYHPVRERLRRMSLDGHKRPP